MKGKAFLWLLRLAGVSVVMMNIIAAGFGFNTWQYWTSIGGLLTVIVSSELWAVKEVSNGR